MRYDVLLRDLKYPEDALENQSEDAFDVASECDQGAVRNDRSVDNSTAAEGRFYAPRSGLERYPLTSGLALSPITY